MRFAPKQIFRAAVNTLSPAVNTAQAAMPVPPALPATPAAHAAPRLPVQIRWLLREDLPAALAIERAGFGDPWDETDFTNCLRGRCCIGMAATCGNLLVGYMIYDLAPSSLDILNFAVDPAYRRRGVGRQMAEKLINKITQPPDTPAAKRRNAIAIEIRETNLAAQLFFKAMGFVAADILRNRYTTIDEDAYLMAFATWRRHRGRGW